MTALVDTFALIGRSHSSDFYKDLYQASIAARAERRVRRPDRAIRFYSMTNDPIVVPKQLLSA